MLPAENDTVVTAICSAPDDPDLGLAAVGLKAENTSVRWGTASAIKGTDGRSYLPLMIVAV
jgi:hypothetical protein